MNSPEINQILYGRNFKILNKAPIKKIEKYFTFLNTQNSKLLKNNFIYIDFDNLII